LTRETDDCCICEDLLCCIRDHGHDLYVHPSYRHRQKTLAAENSKKKNSSEFSECISFLLKSIPFSSRPLDFPSVLPQNAGNSKTVMDHHFNSNI
jgi:hypothetical protein